MKFLPKPFFPLGCRQQSTVNLENLGKSGLPLSTIGFHNRTPKPENRAARNSPLSIYAERTCNDSYFSSLGVPLGECNGQPGELRKAGPAAFHHRFPQSDTQTGKSRGEKFAVKHLRGKDLQRFLFFEFGCPPRKRRPSPTFPKSHALLTVRNNVSLRSQKNSSF